MDSIKSPVQLEVMENGMKLHVGRGPQENSKILTICKASKKLERIPGGVSLQSGACEGQFHRQSVLRGWANCPFSAALRPEISLKSFGIECFWKPGRLDSGDPCAAFL